MVVICRSYVYRLIVGICWNLSSPKRRDKHRENYIPVTRRYLLHEGYIILWAKSIYKTHMVIVGIWPLLIYLFGIKSYSLNERQTTSHIIHQKSICYSPFHLYHVNSVGSNLSMPAGKIIGHVNAVHENPTMHYFTIPRHTQSIIAYKILTEYFRKFQWKVALWECC